MNLSCPNCGKSIKSDGYTLFCGDGVCEWRETASVFAKSLTGYRIKGDCEQGERADLTGCTPVSEEASQKPKEKTPPIPKFNSSQEAQKYRIEKGEVGLHPDTKICFGMKQGKEFLEQEGGDASKAIKRIVDQVTDVLRQGKLALFWVNVDPQTGKSEKVRRIVSVGINHQIRARGNGDPPEGLPMGGFTLLNGDSRIEGIPLDKVPSSTPKVKPSPFDHEV